MLSPPLNRPLEYTMNLLRMTCHWALLWGALTGGLGTATAQTAFPQKPVKILVGFTPGGVPDIAARLLAQKWSEQWKQAVTVENRLGAGSNVAALALSQSPADGHTLLSISSAHAIAPAIYPKLAFDPQKIFRAFHSPPPGRPWWWCRLCWG